MNPMTEPVSPATVDALVPEVVANVAWGGGPKRNILYICGTTSLYSVWLMVNGARLV